MSVFARRGWLRAASALLVLCGANLELQADFAQYCGLNLKEYFWYMVFAGFVMNDTCRYKRASYSSDFANRRTGFGEVTRLRVRHIALVLSV